MDSDSGCSTCVAHKTMQDVAMNSDQSTDSDTCVNNNPLKTTFSWWSIDEEEDQEINILILNLNKLLDEKQKEKASLKCLARQLKHENSAYKSKIKALEKKLSQSKRTLSAKQRIKYMLKLGKVGDNDIKLLKSMLEGKEDKSVEDDKDGFNHLISGSNISTKGQKQIFHCVLSPDESVELSSTGPPVNQHSNSGDCDSDLTTYNDSEGREVQQDDSYLDVQQPIDADENNFEEGDGGGSANEMNQVQNSNSGSSIWNKIDVHSQENDTEQSVDENNLYDAQWFIDQLAIGLEVHNN